MPGAEAEAASLLDAYLAADSAQAEQRARAGATGTISGTPQAFPLQMA